MSEGRTDSLLHEMEAIKKLFILQLLATGYKQKDIARTISVSEATLSRMLPKNLKRDTGIHTSKRHAEDET